MGHDNIQIDHIGFETKPGSRKWADEALVDAFLKEAGDNHFVDDIPGHEFKELIAWGDAEEHIYEEELQQKIPTSDRVVYWTSYGSGVCFWEGPAGADLYDEIQRRFHEFAKAHARKVMKEEVAHMVRRGMGTGLSREDIIELVNEASIEEVMGA